MSVLIVENEAGIRNLAQDQLLRHGVGVTSAATLAEATVAINEHAFTVVILDVTLPDGCGLGVLRHLRHAGSTAHEIQQLGAPFMTGFVGGQPGILRRRRSPAP